MARYYAENIIRTPRPAHKAADLGTAVHAALEDYVKSVYIDKVRPESREALLNLYRMHFMVLFQTVEPESNSWYAEGYDMLKVWFARTDFGNREVLSVETKTSFNVKTSIGDIPFNYIFDRMDKLTDRPDEYEVVDYKTIRKGLNPSDLKKKIQARCYGLAGQIQFPQAKRIWVRFDLLRHDSVATVFTREENIATWRFIQALAEKIIATPEDALVETLNPECGFCVKKVSCETLRKNADGGGLWSVPELPGRIDLLAGLMFQRKGIDSLIGELQDLVMEEMTGEELLEYSTSLFVAKIKQSSRRTVDAERVQHVIGKDLFYQYGGNKMNYTDYQRLIKDKSLTEAQLDRLKELVYRTHGDPRIDIEPVNPID